MNLWLTRDKEGCGHDNTLLWQANDPPTLKGGIWTFGNEARYLCSLITDKDFGTCTALYTERQVKVLCAKAILSVRDGRCRATGLIAKQFVDNPTDANWQRLAAEVGL